MTCNDLNDENDNIIWPTKETKTNKEELLPSNSPYQVTPMQVPFIDYFDEEMETMEIKIGIGLNDIVFGIYQEDVVGILGKPDKILA